MLLLLQSGGSYEPKAAIAATELHLSPEPTPRKMTWLFIVQGLIYFLIADAVSPSSDASPGLGDKDWEDKSVLYLQVKISL